MEESKKSCFVIMPFGEKLDLDGNTVRFDDIYKGFITSAVKAAGLEPVRCDDVMEAGLIHRKMLQHIWDADVAVVDISLLNANVFYELGVRHALRKAVTVLIRRKGTRTPFNIAGMKVIEYDESDTASATASGVNIAQCIANGLRTMENDSLVHEVLDLTVREKPTMITRCKVHEYQLRTSDKKICLVTGNIASVKGIDIWVNSENTNMQMARFYDRSISSMIRYLGARQDEIGITEDTIFAELRAKMANRQSVDPGRVIRTGPGALLEQNGVKQIFHAAAVYGSVGGGYKPIDRVADCVTNSLRLADKYGNAEGWRSILFPLFGTGRNTGNSRRKVESLLEAATAYIADNPECVIEQICFLAFSEEDLQMCQSVLASFSDLAPAPHASAS